MSAWLMTSFQGHLVSVRQAVWQSDARLYGEVFPLTVSPTGIDQAHQLSIQQQLKQWYLAPRTSGNGPAISISSSNRLGAPCWLLAQCEVTACCKFKHLHWMQLYVSVAAVHQPGLVSPAPAVTHCVV